MATENSQPIKINVKAFNQGHYTDSNDLVIRTRDRKAECVAWYDRKEDKCKPLTDEQKDLAAKSRFTVVDFVDLGPYVPPPPFVWHTAPKPLYPDSVGDLISKIAKGGKLIDHLNLCAMVDELDGLWCHYGGRSQSISKEQFRELLADTCDCCRTTGEKPDLSKMTYEQDSQLVRYDFTDTIPHTQACRKKPLVLVLIVAKGKVESQDFNDIRLNYVFSAESFRQMFGPVCLKETS